MPLNQPLLSVYVSCLTRGKGISSTAWSYQHDAVLKGVEPSTPFEKAEPSKSMT